MLATESFFKADEVRRRNFHHKEHKEHKEHIEHKEMEGGNGVREANGITQFAEGEPKRREVFIPKRRSRKPPLDGLRPRSPA